MWENRSSDENRMEQGSAHKLVIVRVSRYLRGIPGFIEGDTTEDVGLRVANSHTSNHRGDDFTPLETIRRFLKLGVDPFRSRRGGLRAGGEGTSMDVMDFKSFMMEGIDGEFHFEPEGGVGDDEGSSPSTRSVDNETSVNDVEPLIFIPPSQFTENTVESDDPSSEKDEVAGKRKQTAESSGRETRQKTLKVPPQASKAAGDSSDPLDVDKLKDSADYHWVVSHVVLDNVMNRRARELMSTLMKARASCDDIQEREKEKDKAYANHEMKCNDALQDLDKNPLVLDMRTKIETLLRQDRVAVVAKVVPHVAMELVHSDKMGLLVARLTKIALFHGRCSALEEVAALKEPFELEKMHGYCPLSKKEFDQASDNLATASYPFLAEIIADPYLWKCFSQRN
ncbi:hypothetical protein Tco_1448667 [Tanacetum coccineum]